MDHDDLYDAGWEDDPEPESVPAGVMVRAVVGCVLGFLYGGSLGVCLLGLWASKEEVAYAGLWLFVGIPMSAAVGGGIGHGLAKYFPKVFFGIFLPLGLLSFYFIWMYLKRAWS